MITALAGGVGAARLLRGMVRVVDARDITAIVNTGDDAVFHGLHVSPDLDTVTYTLAGLNDDARGWGLAGETWRVIEALGQLGGDTWFRLGDRDLATHLYRTARLSDGATLSQVTAEITAALGVAVRLLPMSDQSVATRLTLAGGEEVAFQEYFVLHRHSVPVESIRFDGATSALPAPGVLDAIEEADVVVVCPSNPLVSVKPILAVPRVTDALVARRADVVAVSPIVAGAAIKGPADRLLEELGYESSVVGVARLYAEFVGTLVVDAADAGLAPDVEAAGLRCVVLPTVMHTPEDAAELCASILALDAVGPTTAATTATTATAAAAGYTRTAPR
ncbi:MAG TPA: 2-phospho-L-lactate transferase [Acidimicrobiales bacterium]|nr:2-phospho-L-lactate transferase [Acidimicrobiales bacterium]